jgi:hypothetical protein
MMELWRLPATPGCEVDGCGPLRIASGRQSHQHFRLREQQIPEKCFMSDFDDRLQKAIQRGQQLRREDGASAEADAASMEQLRARHAQLRNELSEHIESCLRKLCDHFPGFEFDTVLNEKGWGARISRDDIRLGRGTAKNEYSRLEVLVRPFSDALILEISTKGTIRNRESLNRSNFRFLREATSESLKKIVDGIALEFAEQFSSQS